MRHPQLNCDHYKAGLMRSVEASGTPATTRKRARNQASTAGLLSLVSVPKLKAGDARLQEDTKSQVGMQMPILRSPKQHMKVADNAVHRGKENRPLTASQPAPASTTSSNKPTVSVGNLPEPKRKLSAALATTKTAKHHSGFQEPRPTPVRSHRLSPSLQHSDHQHGLSMTARQHGSVVDVHNAMPNPSSAKHHQACCSGVSESPAVCTEADQALLAQDVPLACHTAINKRRRPVGQATRYGEWYTGNDTDLDEQLLEYNAEQAHAASVAGLQPERRKSGLASYTADKDDASFTDDEDEEASLKKSSRLRRSTIAPGQDTAAQVAAMTAELNRLADDMLPKEEEQRGREGRKHKQAAQQDKNLRERLLESWDGKTYYERLQAEAEQQLEAKNSEVCSGVVQDIKQTAEEQGNVGAHGLKSQSSHLQWSSSGSQSKARSGAVTPTAGKGKLARAQSPGRAPGIMSPELSGSSEAGHKASRPSQAWAQSGSLPPPLSGRGDSPHGKEGGPAAPLGQPATKAAPWKRLPPLPLSARGAAQGTKSTAATRHAAQPAVNASKQKLHKSSPSKKMPESQQCIPADRTDSGGKATHPGTKDCQHGQQQQHKGKAGVAEGGQQGEHQGCVGSSNSKMQNPVGLSGSEQALVSGASLPVSGAQAQQQPALSKGRLANPAPASFPARSSPCAKLSSNTGKSGQAPEGSVAEPVGMVAAQQEAGGQRGGQQQVARLAASNTALLAELVDLQAAKVLLEEQVLLEQKGRLAAEASKDALSQQLAEQQSALAAAKQQVYDLQSSMSNISANASSSGALQPSAGTSTLEESLRAVKHHAAALAEAAAALETMKL